jgi:hypothetical protein
MLNCHGQPGAGGNQPWGWAGGTHSFIFNSKYVQNDNKLEHAMVRSLIFLTINYSTSLVIWKLDCMLVEDVECGTS